MVEEPLLQQISRMLVGLVLQALSLVVLVHIPLEAVAATFKDYFPLSQRFRSPSSGEQQKLWPCWQRQQ